MIYLVAKNYKKICTVGSSFNIFKLQVLAKFSIFSCLICNRLKTKILSKLTFQISYASHMFWSRRDVRVHFQKRSIIATTGRGADFAHLIGLVYDILTKNIYSLLILKLTCKDIFFCFSCQSFETVHNHQRVSESNHFLSIFLQVYVRPDLVLIFTLLQNFFYITNIFVIAGTNKMFQKWQNIIQFCMKLSHCHRNIVTCMFWVRKKVTHE